MCNHRAQQEQGQGRGAVSRRCVVLRVGYGTTEGRKFMNFRRNTFGIRSHLLSQTAIPLLLLSPLFQIKPTGEHSGGSNIGGIVTGTPGCFMN